MSYWAPTRGGAITRDLLIRDRGIVLFKASFWLGWFVYLFGHEGRHKTLRGWKWNRKTKAML